MPLQVTGSGILINGQTYNPSGVLARSLTFDEPDLSTPTNLPIAAVFNTDPVGQQSFRVDAGSQAAANALVENPPASVVISGSTANDGTYTVQALNDFGGGLFNISVAEAIPDDTVDGHVEGAYFAVSSQQFSLANGEVGMTSVAWIEGSLASDVAVGVKSDDINRAATSGLIDSEPSVASGLNGAVDFTVDLAVAKWDSPSTSAGASIHYGLLTATFV